MHAGNRGTGFYPVLHKRREFSDERELRAVSVMEQPDGPYQVCPLDHEEYGINIERLIAGIVVAPRSPAPFLEDVRRMLDEHGLVRDIQRSSLDGVPVY
jgi:hypothetical protein